MSSVTELKPSVADVVKAWALLGPFTPLKSEPVSRENAGKMRREMHIWEFPLWYWDFAALECE